MPVGAQTAVALALRKASRRPSLPATKYTAARPANSPRRLSRACGFILYKDWGGRGGVTPRLAGHLTRYTAARQKERWGVVATLRAWRQGPPAGIAGTPDFRDSARPGAARSREPRAQARRGRPRRAAPRAPARRRAPTRPRPARGRPHARRDACRRCRARRCPR